MKLLSVLLFLFTCTLCYADPLERETPLYFIENKGQVHDQNYISRSDIDLKICQGNTNLYIGSGHLHYQFFGVLENKLQTWRMDVEMIGANKNARLVLDAPQSYYERYFTAATDGRGVVAHAYAKATYKDIYPGIDWVFYVKNGAVKHDIIVNEGADPSLARLKYAGATLLKINADGSLLAETPLGRVTEARPYCYSSDGNKVNSSYHLIDSILSFQVGAYRGQLTIDPSLLWGTYLHVTNNQFLTRAHDIALYGLTQVYTAGHTSNNNIATVGAYQYVFAGGGSDAFLAKFDTAGNRLWATYYGGTAYDYALGVKCDAAGNIYICGHTGSTNAIATAGSFQEVFGGGEDGFLAKFDSTGDRIWGTYFGASNGDVFHHISIDPGANLYLSGVSQSPGLATTGVHQASNAGQEDALLVKFDSAGNRIWASYYGGAGIDESYVNALDGHGGLYVGGITESVTGIATGGSHQPSHGGMQDGYLAKFDTSGHLLWATYYGGDSTESIANILPDSTDKVYISGTSGDQVSAGASLNNIATNGSYMDMPAGLSEAFLVKFDSTGQRLWGTYYGGSGFDQAGFGDGLAFDPVGDIYICGHTDAAAGIVSGNVWQPVIGGGSDGYIAKFTPAGNQVWATYYGGLLNDQVNDLVFDGVANLYVIGNSQSDNNIATTGAFQTSNQGGYTNGFLSRIYDCAVPALPVAITPDTVCPNATVTFTTPAISGAVSYNWSLPGGWTGTSDSNSIVVNTNTTSGTVTVSANNACGSGSVLSVSIPLYPAPFPTVIQIGNQMNTGNFISYQWYLNGVPISGATSQFYTFSQPGSYTVSVIDSNGCTATSPPFTVGVAELDAQHEFHVYPNPSNGTFVVNSPTSGTLELYNVLGQLLETEKIEKGNTKFTMAESYAAGTYCIRFSSGEDKPTYNVIIIYQP